MNYHIRVRACALILEEDRVLLIEFEDENGLHYNLPAGGMEPGESVIEAVMREALEEAGVEVSVGPLAFVHEFAPHLVPSRQNGPHQISLIFDCTVTGGEPRLPSSPDVNQIGVKWIPLNRLHEIVLYPGIKNEIIAYASGRTRHIELIEEHKLVY
ncbi:NUDIX domain-containing protein [Paenibacillus sp. P26]|nr:NUDIX domain-containing protein [Paenibacillus sp. P26]